MSGGRGFTLVEVLVALVIVAFGVGALLTTLTAAADNVAHLRDKSFAEWIALNRISELRLGRDRPSVGSSNGEVEYAGTRWRWAQTVTEPPLPGMLQIEVQVSRADARAAAGASGPTDQAPPALATAWGFFGSSIATATANDPDWTLNAAPRSPPPGGGGGGGGGPTPPGTRQP